MKLEKLHGKFGFLGRRFIKNIWIPNSDSEAILLFETVNYIKFLASEILFQQAIVIQCEKAHFPNALAQYRITK